MASRDDQAYPQMPPFSEEELTAFLDEMPIARLSSHNPDGTIHTVPGYFKYEDGAILLGTQATTNKVRNIGRDPHVTVLIDNQTPPWKGVMIYGLAEVDHEDVVAKRTAIFERYMPPKDASGLASALAGKYPPAVIRVTPTRFTSWDYSKRGFVNNL